MVSAAFVGHNFSFHSRLLHVRHRFHHAFDEGGRDMGAQPAGSKLLWSNTHQSSVAWAIPKGPFQEWAH